ncbi:MAG: endo alpha-1,4 polygalactosaminidase [Leptospirales bacterium]
MWSALERMRGTSFWENGEKGKGALARLRRLASVLPFLGVIMGSPDDMSFAGELIPPSGNFGIQWGGLPPTAQQISRFDLVILDGYRPPPRAGKTLTFGYFSVGEVRKGSPEETFARAHGLIIGENKDWHSYIVDPRRKVWQDYILARVFPAYRKRGFTGLFLDTIDSPLIMEGRNPARYAGMRLALIRLLREAHRRYPGTPIIVNRALRLLPAIAKSIQGELFEDFCREYYFRRMVYAFVPRAVVRRDNAFVRIARVINPSLTVMTLDYGSPRDTGPMLHCFSEARKRGYHPYFTPLHIRKLRTFNLHNP